VGRRKYNYTTSQKLHKEFCEICGSKDKETLEWHHIIERTELNTSNDPFNLAIICSNCHKLCHAERIKLIGVYPSTNPYGRKLIFEKDGVSNFPGITEPYYKPKPRQSKLYGVDDE
jgi:type II secretory ATPase GspE/PulE/Tfp pilus assembly ATPase PilB-like protein